MLWFLEAAVHWVLKYKYEEPGQEVPNIKTPFAQGRMIKMPETVFCCHGKEAAVVLGAGGEEM